MEVLFGLIGCAIPLIVLLGIVMIALRWNGNVNELRGQVEVLRAELRRMEREVKHLSEFVGRRSTTAPSMHKAAPQPESSSSIVAEQTHSTKQPTDNVAQETQDTVPQPLAESISAQDIDQPELDQSLGAKEFSPLEEMAERSVAAPLSTIDEVESASILTQESPLAPEPDNLSDPTRAEESPQKKASALQPIFNWFARTQIYAQIGILILIIGVGFLVKLVADMGWFPIEVRLASAALLGVGLAAVGWAVRKRARTYGLVLQGGGIGIIYLTTYGTYQIYGLIGPTLAFGIFVGLGLLTVLLSLLNDARVLAFMAVIGAFLAPILISTGSGSHVVLFSYYAVVNLMILAISWFKRWRSLNLVGFLFTLGVGSTWGAQYYQPQFFSTVEPFLVFFFLLYLTISFLFATRSYHEQESRREALVEDGLILFGNPLAALTLQSTLVANIEYGLAWSTLISGLLYIGLAIVLLNRDSQRAEITSEIFLFLGFAFLTLTVPLAFDPRVTAAVWAGAGAGKVWLGHRRDRLWMMLWGVLVQGGAAIAYLIDISDRVDDLILEPPFLNAIYLGALLLSLSALFSAYLLNNRRSAYKYLTQFSWLVSAYGLLVWYLAGIVQISEAVVEPHTFASIVLFVVGSSVFFAVFGKRLAWTALHVPIWGLLPVQILSMFAQLAGTGHFSSNGGWYAWPIALLATYWMLYQNDPQKHHSAIQDNDDAKKLGLQAPYHLGAFWVLMFVLTWEIAYQLGQLDLGAGWSQAVWIGLPALLMAVISRFGPKISWPVAPHQHLYRVIALWPIAIGLLATSLIVNFTSSGNSTPLFYLPVLNPLDLAQIAMFTILFVWLYRIRFGSDPQIMYTYSFVAWAVSVVAFIAFNASIARAIHHLGGVPFTGSALYNSELLQTIYAVLWGILALVLMFLASQRRWRGIWIGGSSILVLTVLKLFFVDLANTGTLARIVSFISVGLLMIVVAYFAPPPPGEEEEEGEKVEVQAEVEERGIGETSLR